VKPTVSVSDGELEGLNDNLVVMRIPVYRTDGQIQRAIEDCSEARSWTPTRSPSS
jgi:hypothetical protein